jgi:hypothetical protein
MTTTPPEPEGPEPTEPFAKDEDGTPDYGRVNAPPPPYGTLPSGYPPPSDPPPAGYGPPPYGYPPYAYSYGIMPKSSAKATWALVLGIISVFCCYLGVFLGPTALILGISGNQEINKSGGAVTGGGLATSGIVLGAIGTVVSALYIGSMILRIVVD